MHEELHPSCCAPANSKSIRALAALHDHTTVTNLSIGAGAALFQAAMRMGSTGISHALPAVVMQRETMSTTGCDESTMGQPVTKPVQRQMIAVIACVLGGLAFVAAPAPAQSYRPVLTPAPGDSGVTIDVERHLNGQLSKRVFRAAGQRNGLWQEWDSAGRVRMTAEWKNGRGEGVWMYFHPNGLVSERSWVTNDIWPGPSEGWHANGQKAFEGTWRDGAKDGPFRYWDETGAPVVSPDGEWVYFSSARHAAREPNNPHRDLYRASRASGWKRVERVTNTPLYGEITLTLARNGRGVLWTDRRRDGSARMGLYAVHMMRQTTPVKPSRLAVGASLTTLHCGDRSGEAYPVIAPDGSFLLFSNHDVDGQRTREDMFITRRTKSGWSPPQCLVNGGNSPADDTASQLLADGKTLLFLSSRAPAARMYIVALTAVLPKVLRCSSPR